METDHLTTLLGAVKEAEVPENCMAVTVVPSGTLKTTHPRTHCPADNPEPLTPKADKEASTPPNWAEVALTLVEAVDPLLNKALKSSELGPVLEPVDPAQVVASIASQTCPGDGVEGY